jgi:hypothetical protein
MAAAMAVEARDVMVQRDAVADFEAAREDARPTIFSTADFYDCAGGFVAEDARRRDGPVMDFFDVGGADAADGDFDEQFIRAEARHGDGFETQVVDAAINDGAHGFRDGGHAEHLATNETRMKQGFLSANCANQRELKIGGNLNRICFAKIRGISG